MRTWLPSSAGKALTGPPARCWIWGQRRQGPRFGAPARPGGRRICLFRDAYGFFDEGPDPNARERPETRRKPRVLEQQALDTLDLPASASLNEIKARYKELVKRHHPDANGGDRSAEERLRKVIQAYDYLRKSGFCS